MCMWLCARVCACMRICVASPRKFRSVKAREFVNVRTRQNVRLSHVNLFAFATRDVSLPTPGVARTMYAVEKDGVTFLYLKPLGTFSTVRVEMATNSPLPFPPQKNEKRGGGVLPPEKKSNRTQRTTYIYMYIARAQEDVRALDSITFSEWFERKGGSRGSITCLLYTSPSPRD